jgi:hypothetical protein
MFREERLQSKGNLIMGGMLCGQSSMFVGEEILKIKIKKKEKKSLENSE